MNNTSEHDPVNHPQHYTSHPSGVECIAIAEHMSFCLGNAVKYIWRADLKDDASEDLRKAVWYIERELDLRERRQISKRQPELSIIDKIRTGVAVLVVLAALPFAAFANPPPAGSEDAQVMGPYKDWIINQHQAKSGVGCCAIADGRLVEERTVGNHYEVRLLHPETLENPPLGWVEVPVEAILPGANPVGSPIAWYVGHTIRCFITVTKT